MSDQDDIKELSPIVIPSGQDLTIDLQNVKKEYSFGKYLDRAEVLARLQAIPQDRPKHLMFFQYLWRTGCRVSEACDRTGITKGQIDFQEGYITIKWLKNRKYHHRIIPMHSTLRNPLYLLSAALKADERLFPWTRQRADQLAKKYGFGSCHRLRHSYAVNFLRQSKSAWDLVILQRLMGHDNIRTTMRYLEAVPADQKNAIEEVKFD